MWSLFKKKEGEGVFDYSGEELPPLRFSNGKTQADVVAEILDLIEKGNKIIFIRGVCGSGKSAIALNLARHFKKTSIVVPIKSLQKQYEEDYTNKNFILKKDKSQLKISVVKGRQNFRCPFSNVPADDDELPCTIELREKNMERILKYIALNHNVDKTDFSGISDVRRMSVAPACPYWSPVLPSEVSSKVLKNMRKRSYSAVCGIDYSLFQGKKGCGYYDQYESYIDSDVLIFNSQKYLIETLIGRKPKTDLEIIDECDEFLDNFANEKRINLNRLLFSLSNLFPDTRERLNAVKDLIHCVNGLIFDSKEGVIERVGDSGMIDFIRKVLDSPYLAEDEDTNYYNNVFEICKEFEHLLGESYVLFSKVKGDREENVFADLVTINLAQKFKDIVEMNNVLVLMSGTVHSEKVLRDIFGLEDFKIVEAETIPPGTITKFRTGLEKNCKYANFKSGLVSRCDYLKAMDCCVENAKLPALIHVSSFGDLPNELEKAEYDLKNVITKERLLSLQGGDKNNRAVDKFKAGRLMFCLRRSVRGGLISLGRNVILLF